ncbi:uncharacterized protein LOC124959452 [Sciurus carolinensis]|uniref:uncharacterized protein LOC124959452 n=1 Tax=Sciurus carolinensis TaxID=30640 RepID=UPI001FB2F73D|nr:uncharacterized protein LOC124959452 [Sciurus carolinensis]
MVSAESHLETAEVMTPCQSSRFNALTQEGPYCHILMRRIERLALPEGTFSPRRVTVLPPSRGQAVGSPSLTDSGSRLQQNSSPPGQRLARGRSRPLVPLRCHQHVPTRLAEDSNARGEEGKHPASPAPGLRLPAQTPPTWVVQSLGGEAAGLGKLVRSRDLMQCPPTDPGADLGRREAGRGSGNPEQDPTPFHASILKPPRRDRTVFSEQKALLPLPEPLSHRNAWQKLVAGSAKEASRP